MCPQPFHSCPDNRSVAERCDGQSFAKRGDEKNLSWVPPRVSPCIEPDLWAEFHPTDCSRVVPGMKRQRSHLGNTMRLFWASKQRWSHLVSLLVVEVECHSFYPSVVCVTRVLRDNRIKIKNKFLTHSALCNMKSQLNSNNSFTSSCPFFVIANLRKIKVFESHLNIATVELMTIGKKSLNHCSQLTDLQREALY